MWKAKKYGKKKYFLKVKEIILWQFIFYIFLKMCIIYWFQIIQENLLNIFILIIFGGVVELTLLTRAWQSKRVRVRIPRIAKHSLVY